MNFYSQIGASSPEARDCRLVVVVDTVSRKLILPGSKDAL